MTPRRRAALFTLSLCCAAVALPGVSAAQGTPAPQPPVVSPVVPSQAEKYLLATDVGDARALFVNPAGLARGIEATLGAFATVADSTAGARLAQYGALVASRGAAFGWQHDELAGGASANTFVAGLALGSEQFSMGGDHRWYTGAGKGGSWDAAAHYRLGLLDLAAVWRNIGSPAITTQNPAGRLTLEETVVAGAAVDLFRRARISGEWHAATSGFATRYVRGAVILVAGRGVLFTAIGTFSGDPSNRSMTFAIQMHAPRFRAALFGREPSQVNAASEYGAALASITPAPTGWNTHTQQQP